jgi:ABC-type Na+ efflux pump permease subunit
MKKLVTACVLLGFAALVMTSFAADEAKKKEKKKAGGFDPTAALVKKAADEGLPEDAIAKIKTVAAEHAPKLRAAQAKVDALLTPEQKKARGEAMKAARAAGKKRKELQADIAAALNLSDDQQEKIAAAQKESRAAITSFRQAVAAQLTPEQQTKLGLVRGKKKGK